MNTAGCRIHVRRRAAGRLAVAQRAPLRGVSRRVVVRCVAAVARAVRRHTRQAAQHAAAPGVDERPRHGHEGAAGGFRRQGCGVDTAQPGRAQRIPPVAAGACVVAPAGDLALEGRTSGGPRSILLEERKARTRPPT
eukprot:364412-Chlamydomonas_euryale.AAC.5